MSVMARTNTNEGSDVRQFDYPCGKCGQGIPKTTVEKRVSRGMEKWDLCEDCLRLPARAIVYKHPQLGQITCYPYAGDLDELWRPIDEFGVLYRPGERLCGHKDCINLNHIVGRQVHRKYANNLESLLALIEVQDYNTRARTS